MKRVLLAAAAGLFLLSSCKKDSTSDPNPAETPAQLQAKTDAVDGYADLALASYRDAEAGAVLLDQRIGAFVLNPTQAGLDTLRATWIRVRAAYSQSEVFRFYGGPIDGEDGPEDALNGWPLDESYIDYVQGATDTSSIIARADKYPRLTPGLLDSLNMKGGETNVSSGWHAIEFLLWGQDRSTTGPGNRPVSDFTTAAHAERRKAYLKACSELLVEQLGSVRAAWEPGAGYRTTFTTAITKDEALGHIFRGMGALAKAETGGERTRVALASADQEDEQSCFSDNTTADIVNNIIGIRNVYTGVWASLVKTAAPLAKPSPYAAIAARDQAKADAAKTALETALTASKTIPTPFDQAILANPGRAAIQATADDLSTLADKLVDAAYVYRITVSTGN